MISKHFRVVSSETSNQIEKYSLAAFENSNVHWLYTKPDRKTEKKLSHLNLLQPPDFMHHQQYPHSSQQHFFTRVSSAEQLSIAHGGVFCVHDSTLETARRRQHFDSIQDIPSL